MAAAPSTLPIVIGSIHLAFEGNRGAIPLRDPVTGDWLGDNPEWSRFGVRRPAAFVGGSRPRVRVRFQATPGTRRLPGVWKVGARGTRCADIPLRRVALKFDAAGVSQPVDFALAEPMPTGIGRARVWWHWFVEHAGENHVLLTTEHELYHTWRAPVSHTEWAVGKERASGPFGDTTRPWCYLPTIEWTCAWARGRDDPKAICDAILRSLHRSGLKYAVSAWDVGGMLQAGGGYCGGFYRMFQALAGAQGVAVERRALHVDWRVEADKVMRWCALAVDAPGLNRDHPNEGPSVFHDSDRGPHVGQAVDRVRKRRYRFWGHPDRVADGHCLNFLRHEGIWYLYDASFCRRPIRLRDFQLPRPDRTQAIAVETQGNFQLAYLAKAVPHMLGSLRHTGRLYRTMIPDADHPQFSSKSVRNGLTVRTAIIPRRWRNLTFYWTG